MDETFYLRLNAEDIDTIRVNGIGRDHFEVFFNGKNTNDPTYYSGSKPTYTGVYFLK